MPAAAPNQLDVVSYRSARAQATHPATFPAPPVARRRPRPNAGVLTVAAAAALLRVNVLIAGIRRPNTAKTAGGPLNPKGATKGATQRNGWDRQVALNA